MEEEPKSKVKVAGGNSASSETTNQGRFLRVVTYNIAGNHASYDTQKLTQVLVGLKVDLVFLQEVSDKKCDPFPTQAHALASALRMNCVFGQPAEGRVFGNAILSVYPLHSATEILLPHGSLYRDDGSRMPGQKERRLALAGVVSPIREDPSFDFLCIATHFGLYNTLASTPPPEVGNAEGEKKEAVKKTLPECAAPVEEIRKFVNHPSRKEMPCLLGGDLNAKPSSATLQLFDRNWNLHEELHNNVPTRGDPDAEDVLAGSKIDYILDRSRGKYKMEFQKSLTFQESLKASDHRPLLAEWRMK